MSTKEQREKLGRIRKALEEMTEDLISRLDERPGLLDKAELVRLTLHHVDGFCIWTADVN
jgi:hypothetical protein